MTAEDATQGLGVGYDGASEASALPEVVDPDRGFVGGLSAQVMLIMRWQGEEGFAARQGLLGFNLCAEAGVAGAGVALELWMPRWRYWTVPAMTPPGRRAMSQAQASGRRNWRAVRPTRQPRPTARANGVKFPYDNAARAATFLDDRMDDAQFLTLVDILNDVAERRRSAASATTTQRTATGLLGAPRTCPVSNDLVRSHGLELRRPDRLRLPAKAALSRSGAWRYVASAVLVC